MDAPKQDYETHLVDDHQNDQQVEKSRMGFGEARDLQEIRKEWQFFTPALLYLFGRFTDEPLARFKDQFELQLTHYKFERAIFSGMSTPIGNSEWDHVLWAVPITQWQVFESHLIQVTSVDYSTRTTYGVGAQDVKVLDPLFADRNVVLPLDPPMLDVVVLGVNGNRNGIALSTPTGDVIKRPKVKFHPPTPLALKYADALFKGKNPTATMDKPQIGT